MKNLKKITTAIILATSLTVNAAPKCDDVLQACDAALNDQIQITTLQKAIIDDMEKRTGVLVDENARLKTDMGAWYRNPIVVGGISLSLGVILGAILVGGRK